MVVTQPQHLRLVEGRYEPQVPDENSRFWIPEMNLFLGTWDGQRSNLSTTWLRWWDSSGNPLLWGREQIEQERQRAERLTAQLRALGVEPDGGSGE